MTASSIPGSPGTSGLYGLYGVADRLLTFGYRGWLVSCGTRRTDGGFYEPVVFCRSGNSDEETNRLPADTDNAAYATEAEALRHGEQQAMRWINERSSMRNGA